MTWNEWMAAAPGPSSSADFQSLRPTGAQWRAVARTNNRTERQDMKTLKHAVVFPIITGDTWCETAPPIRLPRDSKAAALRALRDAGYRVMRKGGTVSVREASLQELTGYGGDNPKVARAARWIGSEIESGCFAPDSFTEYCISVYP